MSSLRAYLEGDSAGAVAAIRSLQPLTRRDPESGLYTCRHLARMGECELALATLAAVLDAGFLCTPSLRSDPWLEPLRGIPAFQDLTRAAERRQAEVDLAFVAAGGEQILEVRIPERNPAAG